MESVQKLFITFSMHDFPPIIEIFLRPSANAYLAHFEPGKTAESSFVPGGGTGKGEGSSWSLWATRKRRRRREESCPMKSPQQSMLFPQINKNFIIWIWISPGSFRVRHLQSLGYLRISAFVLLTLSVEMAHVAANFLGFYPSVLAHVVVGARYVTWFPVLRARKQLIQKF